MDIKSENTQSVSQFSKKDAVCAVIVGELTAWLLFIMAKVNAYELPIPSGLAKTLTSVSGGVALAVILPIVFIVGLYVAYFLSKKISFIYEAAKFGLVGALNTFVDLGVLNALIFITGVSSGAMYSVFKGSSFLVAVVNSYVWNKYWTFKSKKENVKKEFTEFFFVSLIGFLLNVGTAAVVVNLIGPKFGVAAEPWANVGALAGTFVVLACNFVGYKFWVFKKK